MSTELAFDLRNVGNVPTSYRHHRRVVAPGQPQHFDGLLLKWYEISLQDHPASEAMTSEIRCYVERLVSSGVVPTGHGVGFVIFHHSALTYLIIGIWDAHQELWTAHYVRNPDDVQPEFERVIPGVSGNTMCVWELAPVWHERQAWTRYLFSNRTEDDKLLFVNDQLSGSV